MAQTTTEYAPETIIAGPQYSDGVMTHVYLAVNSEEGWTIADDWRYYQGSEPPAASPDPAQEELGLTAASGSCCKTRQGRWPSPASSGILTIP